jgi:diguanylate cyclase (GGDEF)-like protein
MVTEGNGPESTGGTEGLNWIVDPRVAELRQEHPGMPQLAALAWAHQEMLRRNAALQEQVGDLTSQVARSTQGEAEARELATTDRLTGVRNRLGLDQEFTRLTGAGATGAVVYIDLDHFKPVNDNFGHAYGDRVLQTVSQRITGEVRTHDVVARLGGDEFGVLCPGLQFSGAALVAGRIHDAISGDRINLEGHPSVRVTASIGVGPLDTRTRTLDENLKLADDAMYQAKRRGGDQVVHWGDL